MRSTPEEIATAIEGATDIIRFQGWHQGAFVGRDLSYEVTGYCTMGALAISVGGQELLDKVIGGMVMGDNAVYFDALVVINDRVEDHATVDMWNDDPGRTKEQVIDVLEQVSKDLRNGTSGWEQD